LERITTFAVIGKEASGKVIVKQPADQPRVETERPFR
jgi:hypothetical protein